ncbi:hypothetical protein [Aerosakkonema funiforme]|uniref:Uncharacterized protein n=1 Tax=Aerosakkonema funiforme FACHB-1375 TaxID=2949571 RepID=A0A926ZH00_9CYAN|nr:hypothetical protein [Aerosakkonema funiforme]MBD2182109.1 hypothetical protein [Aerosakkonema funiforme FACHB-1375]
MWKLGVCTLKPLSCKDLVIGDRTVCEKYGATDPTLDVEQLVDLGGDSTRLDEAPENAAAVERPSDRYKSGYDRD